MKIKIVSDGSVAGTAVCCAETGEVLEGIQIVDFRAVVGQPTEAFLHVLGISCDIITHAAQDLLPDLNPYEPVTEELNLDEIKDFLNDHSTD